MIGAILLLAGCEKPSAHPVEAATVSAYRGCTAVRTETSTALVDGFEPFDGSVTTTTFDDSGERVRLELSSPNEDRVVDERWQRRPDGQFTVHTRDLGADGTIDETETAVFEGDLAVRVEIDADGDGVVDAVDALEYDALDRLVTRRTDTGLDGTTDVTWTGTWDGDSARPLTTLEVEADSETVETYGYDAADRLSSYLLETTNPFFEFEFEATWEYVGDAVDPSTGSSVQAFDGDTPVHAASSYRFDADHRSIEQVTRYALTGDPLTFEVELVAHTEWTCP
ncbi:MAG: hypothetical protein ABMA64_19420 [Myxococcota bacterium]